MARRAAPQQPPRSAPQQPPRSAPQQSPDETGRYRYRF
jgi:hypothetical protein